MAAHNRIDTVRPDAPELAAFGALAVGARTLALVHHDQLDVVCADPGAALRYDRPLVVELWYPAVESSGPTQCAYEAIAHGGAPVTLFGRARRDAPPLRTGAAFPLVILSHGYVGNRFLLSHFGENLASKGYVVASIDHTDSTYADQAAFGSTLLNRPLDQLFVLSELARLAGDGASPLAGIVDADRSAIIGYSMGGYGALNAVGGGVSAAAVELELAPPNGALRARQAGRPEYAASLDSRVRAVVAIGPWGMHAGIWDDDGLAGIRTPVLFMAGDLDDVSGYECGVEALYEATRNAERCLLTFENANHNAAAPIPPPAEISAVPEAFAHHADPVWDTVRMNNVAQHFATAFLGVHLLGDETLAPFLELTAASIDGVMSHDAEGERTAEHTYWRGFPDRTAAGLRWRRARPG